MGLFRAEIKDVHATVQLNVKQRQRSLLSSSTQATYVECVLCGHRGLPVRVSLGGAGAVTAAGRLSDRNDCDEIFEACEVGGVAGVHGGSVRVGGRGYQ
jgi:hypothetical protein